MDAPAPSGGTVFGDGDLPNQRPMSQIRAIASGIEAAESAWVDTVMTPTFMSEYLSQCTPGYYNAEGKAGQGEGFFEGHYPEGAVNFYNMLKDWREEGSLAGLKIEE